MVGRVRAAAEEARATLRAPAAVGDYALLAQVEQLDDACVQLGAAAASGTSVIELEVPALTSLAALCASLYPGEALARMGEVLAANPERIPNPAVIRPGTRLVVPRPPNRT